MTFPTRTFLTILALSLAPLPALADDCGAMKLVTSFQLEDNPYHSVIVPVTINGTPRKFLFDTGGAFTQISPQVTSELKLTTRSSNYKLQDVNGYASNMSAIVDDFAFGPFKGKNVPFQVATVGQADGILTTMLFPHLDFDIDFGPRRMNLFLNDHCPGKVMYWKADKVAVVPVTLRNNHFNLDVVIDGKTLRGIVDTGASRTMMSTAAAYRFFGIKPDSDGKKPDGYINGDNETPYYLHSFSSLGFEGVAVANASVMIAPDRTGVHDRNNDLEAGSYIRHVSDDIRQPDIILGMNVLSKLHIYFATREGKLYITAAGAPDAPSPFAPAAPPKP